MRVQLKKLDCILSERPTGERVSFSFYFGPVRFDIVVMLPYDDEKQKRPLRSIVYIKAEIEPRMIMGLSKGSHAEAETWETFDKDE